MDLKKLEKLENIRNFLENDNLASLKRYVEKIKPLVKKDNDFEDVFEELENNNYDQALTVIGNIIFEMKGDSQDEDIYDQFVDLQEEDDDFIYDGQDSDFSDLGIEPLEGEEFFDDHEDYY